MKTKAKVLIIAATTAIALGALGTSFAAADQAKSSQLVPLQQSAKTYHKKGQFKRMMHRKPQSKVWERVLQPNRHLTKEDALTITHAMILLHGEPGQKVGGIEQVQPKPGRTFYKIKIVNKDNQLMRTLIMNSANGHVRPIRLHKAK